MDCSVIAKSNVFKVITGLFLLLFCNIALAAAGCCSHHNGVKGCDAASNHLLCKDGTTSPSCLCSGATESTTTKVKKTVKTTPAATTATTYEKTTTTSTVDTSAKKMKGCCSKHGGVSGCDATGYAKCKDGSVSATCKC